MSFNQLFECILNENGNFVCKASAVRLEDGIIRKDFVNIRLFSKYMDKWFPTKVGICISLRNFERIAPLLESLRPFVIGEDNEVIEFVRAPNATYLYEIRYTKFNGKQQSVNITENEIRKLSEVKDQLISSFN